MLDLTVTTTWSQAQYTSAEWLWIENRLFEHKMEEWRYLTQSLFSSKVLTEYPSYLEPGREAERVRRQEGGEGVAVVRAVMLRLPGVNILQINRLFEQIALKNEKFGSYVPFHELP